MSGSVEGAESPSSAGASEAASTPVSEGASTTRDGLGSDGARDDVGAASSLPSVSAACSKMSALAVGAATRGGEVALSSTVVVPTAAEVAPSSSMVVPTATVAAASAGGRRGGAEHGWLCGGGKRVRRWCRIAATLHRGRLGHTSGGYSFASGFV